MPNTLCHIGVQLPITRLVAGRDFLLWAVIACIIPDLPWITLRILVPVGLFDPYDLRLYCTAQASLFFCLFLSAALSCTALRTGRVFLVLAGNCLFHLLLDPLEIKWGNGVHLVAPSHWNMLHLDLIWPEHPVVLAFTLAGFLLLLLSWKRIAAAPLGISWSPAKWAAGLLFLILYLAGPLFVLDKLEEANTYHLHTLRMREERPGKAIELDRVHYNAREKTVKTFAGERIAVIGSQPEQSGRVSFRGRFQTPGSFVVDSYHYHPDERDMASLIGLFMACTLLFHSVLLSRFHAPNAGLRPQPKGCHPLPHSRGDKYLHEIQSKNKK